MFLIPYLNEDAQLTTLLGAPNRIFQLEASDIAFNSIVITPTYYGGSYVKEMQVECRVITRDFANGMSICERLEELLITKEDKESKVANNTYYRCSLASGYAVKRLDFDGYDMYRVFAVRYVEED